MRKSVLMILLIILLASFVYSSAQWYETPPKWEMKNKLHIDYCPYASQCLVDTALNETLNNMPEEYFTDPDKPRCINDTQFILDYYCDNGKWTTRTKLIGLELLKHANSASPNDFVLYCDDYKNVMNNYDYLVLSDRTVYGLFTSPMCYNNPCFNHVCVLEYGGKTAIGVSSNAEINDSVNSPLLAFNASETICSNVPSTAVSFSACSNNDFYYNPKIESIIYTPTDPLSGTSYIDIMPHFNVIKDYVMDELHSPNLNFSFFNATSLFNKLYYAKKSNKEIFGFLELEQSTLRVNYFGIRYRQHSFGSDPCLNIFEKYDENGLNVFCRNQPGNNDFILVGTKIAGSGVPLSEARNVKVWQDLTSKLRPQ